MSEKPRTVVPELVEAYQRHSYDPLQPADLLHDEVRQRRESGYDVDALVEQANATDPNDRRAVLALVDGMADLERRSDWPFEEPAEACGWIDTAPIAEADRQKVGRDNAVKLFKLPA